MKSLYWAVLACVAVGATTLAAVGCGGADDVFGRNSDVDVSVVSDQVQDIELVVAPEEGDSDDFRACDADSDGFGCVRRFFADEILFEFTTTSDASTSPYHVYLVNRSNQTVDIADFSVSMDNDVKLSGPETLAPGETLLVARIFRNNAERPLVN